MGAWGSGPFENDDACDWSYDLVDGGGPEVVATALRTVIGGEPPRSRAASSAVGAAAVVAAGLGVTDVDLPGDVTEWLSGVDAAVWPSIAQEAVMALDRVMAESELLDLWGEVGDGAWAAVVSTLRKQIHEAR